MGAHKITEAEASQQSVIATHFVVHEKWDSLRIQNDIALIKLPDPIQFNGKTNYMIYTIKVISIQLQLGLYEYKILKVKQVIGACNLHSLNYDLRKCMSLSYRHKLFFWNLKEECKNVTKILQESMVRNLANFLYIFLQDYNDLD